jgi:biotin operon repressor
VTSPSLIEDIKAMRAKKHSLRFIADKLGVGRGTVEKYTKEVRSG